ncbi:MAG: 16S rRNA (uracil(1498)-N(3))-methyltransferase [Hyphomicrobiales bacterium]
MARYNFKMQRLYIDHPLLDGGEVVLDKNQSNYLINVLRMGVGAELLVFNGKDGEWLAVLEAASKKAASLRITEQTRPQPESAELSYYFAPLKHARLDYMVQKAVEMGVGRLCPVFTDHTQVNRLNLERMRANAIEAAEQCGILTIPSVEEPTKLQPLIDTWPNDATLIFCDESEEGDNPITLLQEIASRRIGVFIGPEGGFSENERSLLKAQTFVKTIPLGPRILRADTAAVAALAVIQAAIGDWVCKQS